MFDRQNLLAPGRETQENNTWFWIVPVIMIALLLSANMKSFLLFHVLAEFFAIIVAILLSVVAWQTFTFTRNNFLMFLGCGYLWIASLDMVHALTYKGMNIYPMIDVNVTVQFWVATRYFEALLLLIAPLFLVHRFSRISANSFFAFIAVSIYLLVMQGKFPETFIEGQGLTTFKVVSEYIIIGLLGIAIIHLWCKRELLDKSMLRLMVASIILTIFAEIAFTFYVNLYGLSNQIGHIFKFLSFWLIFVAIIRTTLQKPFHVMARGASTYDAVPDAIVLIDKQGKIRQANRQALKLATLKEAEILGQDCHVIYHPNNIKQEDCEICRQISNVKSLDSIELYCENKQLWYDYSLSLVNKGSEDAGMVHVIRDISQRKKVERELSQYRNHLEQQVALRTRNLELANKELETFSYSVSHDLRAPLRSIEGFAEIILEDNASQLDESGKEHLNRLKSNTNKMKNLIDALLNLSRINQKQFNKKSLNLSMLAENELKSLADQFPNRDVDISIKEGMVDEGDEGLVAIMLSNLLGNAWKYTSKTPRAKIEFGNFVKDDKLVYFIRDNGAGFNMQYSKKLFGAFQRLHNNSEFPGTGIGLATVQRIVHRHGGEIWAESEVDAGATFYFTLDDGH